LAARVLAIAPCFMVGRHHRYHDEQESAEDKPVNPAHCSPPFRRLALLTAAPFNGPAFDLVGSTNTRGLCWAMSLAAIAPGAALCFWRSLSWWAVQ
jgi:hypothetical protein